MTKTPTLPYDVADQLKTPEDRAAYLAAWFDEAPDDAAGIARALADVARAARCSNRHSCEDSINPAASPSPRPGFRLSPE